LQECDDLKTSAAKQRRGIPQAPVTPETSCGVEVLADDKRSQIPTQMRLVKAFPLHFQQAKTKLKLRIPVWFRDFSEFHGKLVALARLEYWKRILLTDAPTWELPQIETV